MTTATLLAPTLQAPAIDSVRHILEGATMRDPRGNAVVVRQLNGPRVFSAIATGPDAPFAFTLQVDLGCTDDGREYVREYSATREYAGTTVELDVLED